MGFPSKWTLWALATLMLSCHLVSPTPAGDRAAQPGKIEPKGNSQDKDAASNQQQSILLEGSSSSQEASDEEPDEESEPADAGEGRVDQDKQEPVDQDQKEPVDQEPNEAGKTDGQQEASELTNENSPDGEAGTAVDNDIADGKSAVNDGERRAKALEDLAEQIQADTPSDHKLNSIDEALFRSSSVLSSKIAVAPMVQAVAAATAAGNIVFYQSKPLSAVRIVGSLVLAAAPSSLTVEIHATGDAGSSCANVGRLYNPLGVNDGGVVLRSGATIQGTFASFFVDDKSVFQISLYGDTTTIIGKSVVVYSNGAAVACGVISETTQK